MKKLIAILLALVMVFGLVACGAKEEAPSSAKEETKTEEKKEEKKEEAGSEDKYLRLKLDMNQTQTGFQSNYIGQGIYLRMIFEALMAYDTETEEYKPWLAESLDVSADGLDYTVKLRDSKWHDGEPVTADDVVFTFNQSICGGSLRAGEASGLKGFEEAASGAADSVSGIEKIDEKTVVFHLKNPNSLFVDALACTSFLILPEHLLKDTAPSEMSTAKFWENPVGSGPYCVCETHFPDYAVLAKVEDYYKPAGIEKVLISNISDTNDAMIAGELDFSANISQEQMEIIKAGNPDITFDAPATTYRRGLYWNFSGKAGTGTTHPSTANARVRKAIEMLIDKENIAKMFGEDAIPLTTDINPGFACYNSDLPEFKRDVEGAKKILEEEGFDFSVPIRLWSSYTDQTSTDVFEFMAQNLAEGGVTMEYVQDDNYEPYLLGADFDYYYCGGMSSLIINLFTEYTIANRNEWNAFYPMEDEKFVAYITERYDDLVNEYTSINDADRQVEIIKELQANMYDDCLVIQIYAVNPINAINTSHVEGFTSYARDYEENVDLKCENWKLVG